MLWASVRMNSVKWSSPMSLNTSEARLYLPRSAVASIQHPMMSLPSSSNQSYVPQDISSSLQLSLPRLPSLDNTFGAVLLGSSYTEDHGYYIATAGDLPYRSMHPYVVIYYYLTTNYFNPTALLSGVWSLRLLPVVTGTLIVVCHSFYARRIYLLGTRYRTVVGLVIVFMVGELAFVIASTTEAFIQPSFAEWEKYTWLISTAFGFAVAADMVLTSTLIYILRASRTGFKSTDSLIDVLVVYTINTGLLTGFFSIMSLVFAVACPDNLIYVSLNMLSTRTYANSVLAVLNSRRSLNDRGAFGVDAGTFGMCAFESTGRTVFGSTESPPTPDRVGATTWNRRMAPSRSDALTFLSYRHSARLKIPGA
ncbi:hypothetical protein C8Q76DRAFT_81068 [Earliella scabrosa]|nr:hypothetical protein C8Q76DRAFT_81068 [Earliella scabrosa]